jgi:branched-subunit amino acid aminotransferase/4-amino-4-deoxychorismate lyase
VDARGRLLEGLVTNVFVVAEEGDGGGGDEGEAGGRASEGGRGGVPGGGGRSDLSRFSLHTASAASDGVLDGTMRRAVLEAADALGIPVVSSPPDPSERRRWREAFVTSALRGVAAVARVGGQGGGGPAGGEPWSVDFSREVPGRVTREIAEALPCVMRRHEVKL